MNANASSHPITTKPTQGPIINDPKLKAEVVFRGLNFPTSMAFLGPNDILVLEKNDGTVHRIVDGKIFPKPLLGVNVATQTERGMLGIAVTDIKNNGNTGRTTYVLLYYSEAGVAKVGDHISDGINPKCNCLYRYELLNNTITNPKLLLNLPAIPGPFHNGGRILIGPDNNVYLTIGDLFSHNTKSQNLKNGTDPDGTGGILRITQDGKPVGKGILGDRYPLNLYYAYGIRNSFGIDFDPVTAKLWDTENGPSFGDEINLVEPGFNSGWSQIQGIWKPVGGLPPQKKGPVATNPQGSLEDFGGKGKYRAPELIWDHTVGPTALKFLSSDKLGKQYQNDMFVGDFNNGNLYHFKLNKERNGLILNDSIPANNIVSTNQVLEQPTDWLDPSNHCGSNYKCTVNSTTGWQNNIKKTSFQISTSSTNNKTWSWIYGKEIIVKPLEQYQLVTHMKLNKFVIGSHIAVEGYNNKTKQWEKNNQIIQCPSGINGPLEWKQFKCNITIPKDITKIRLILNAGWSSQPGKEAVTQFDDIYALNNKTTNMLVSSHNLVSNSDFVYFDDFVKIISLCQLRGDFDVQIDYRLVGWPQSNGVGLSLIAKESDNNELHDALLKSVERVSMGSGMNLRLNATELYRTRFNDDIHQINATSQINNKPANDTLGKLRLERSGSKVIGYYYNSGSWIPIHSNVGTIPSDINIVLRAGAGQYGLMHQPVKIDLLDYIINKGQLVNCQNR